jgi:hypothetical protein
MSTLSRNKAQMRSRVKSDPRRRWGWGPSALASVEEEEAWEEIETDPNASPLERLGPRPMGYSRRGIRMQAEWDAEYSKALDQEKTMLELLEKEKAIEQRERLARSAAAKERAEREQALLVAKQEEVVAEAEARLAEYANTLDPFDPTSASKIAAVISKTPPLLNNPKATGMHSFFTKSASKSEAVVKMEEEATIQQSLREARQAGVFPEQIAATKTLDKDGNETYDLGKLRYATDITVGSRVAEAETRKQPTDTRTPLEKAEDDLAEKRARLGAFVDEEGVPPEYDEMTESYRRALADVKQSEARVKRLGGEPEPEEPEEEEEYPDEQIKKARAIAQNPSHPRNKDAIRFLKSIGQSY